MSEEAVSDIHSLWHTNPHSHSRLHTCSYSLTHLRSRVFILTYALTHSMTHSRRSVIAENHFDGSRNMVVLLGGLRRYILSHPKHCSSMYLLPSGHPSGRHSSNDWSLYYSQTSNDGDQQQQQQQLQRQKELFPLFERVRANEVILTPGDVLFIPTGAV